MSTSTVQHSVPEPATYSSPPITIILTIILLLFFFVGFFSIYFCRCFMQNLLYTWHLRHSPTATPIGPAGPSTTAPGLDPKIIESFPSFTYSSVKEYRREKYGLECAICLVEFVNEDVLRLLTSCCHVFHQECIDLWLENHDTCPVCRRSLDTALLSPQKCPSFCNNNAMHDRNENDSLEDSFSITIKDDNEDERGDSQRAEREPSGNAGQQVECQNKVEIRYPRSHSTGHSILRVTKEEELDKFTLRLPESVKANIISGHNATRSCTTFGEFESRKGTGNGGFGEASGVSGGH